jgi:hypothetical protein
MRAVLVASLVVGCGGKSGEDDDVGANSGDDDDGNDGDGPGAEPSGPVSAANFTEELSQAMCGGIGGCCDEAGLAYDRANCEVVLNAVYGSVLQEATTTDAFDEELAGDCVAQVRADSSSCNFANFGGDSCNEVFSAATAVKRQEGEACGQSCELAADGRSCFVHSNDPGECYREDGLYCDAAIGECARLVPDGEQCAESLDCETGFCSSTVCIPKLPRGADCAFDDRACESGLRCDFSSGSCAPKVAAGGDCLYYEDCESNSCGADGTCEEPGAGDSAMLLALACGG